MEHANRLDSEIIYDRDFHYDYFGFKTLERSYLLRIDGKIVERPQHMLMRVSVGIHENNIEQAIRTYHLMSGRWFTHASPTLFNAGTPRPQLSSCFLLCMKDDSIDGIYDTLKQCAIISKSAGGIGLSAHAPQFCNYVNCVPSHFPPFPIFLPVVFLRCFFPRVEGVGHRAEPSLFGRENRGHCLFGPGWVPRPYPLLGQPLNCVPVPVSP